LKSLGVVVPPKPEQQAILTFLDRETSRIDRLIIEQRTLIERLKEKRIAIICRAVTKGLNLSAPMKQSGVNWLGVVPVSWTLTKLKKVAEFVGGGTPDTTKSEFWDGGIPWVSSKDMKSEIIRDTEDTISQLGLESSASRIVRPGSVLMVVRSGILRHTIPVAINEVPVSINQDIRAITFNNEMDPRFFMRLVQGLQEELLFAWRKQGATVESLEQDYVSNTIVPVPPIDTQVEIVGYLERVMSDLDQLVAEAESGIELLLEHRSALISAVVTGKVDVRTSMAGTA
jgi:type I restriction enzyme S subunit